MNSPGIIGMEMANRNDSCQGCLAGIKKAPCGTSLDLMGWMMGIEPTTSGITIRRSNHLSYTHHSYGAPDRTRTCNLRLRRPLLYPVELRARFGLLVGVEGFEPPTPWSQTRCATRLRYTPTRDEARILVSALRIVKRFLCYGEVGASPAPLSGRLLRSSGLLTGDGVAAFSTTGTAGAAFSSAR